MKGANALLGIAAVMIVVCVAFAALNWEESDTAVNKTYYNEISQSQISDLQEQAKNGATVNVTIELTGGKKITLDTDAVLSLNSAASLTIDEIPDSEKTEADKAAVGDAAIYNVSLGDNTNFGAGYATVTIPYTLKSTDDPDNIMVACIDEDSNLTGYYYGAYSSGFVTFKTGHFSKFAVMQGDVALEVAFRFDYNGVFGNFAKLDKVSDRLYSVTAESGLSSSPYNTVYFYAGSDSAAQYKDKVAQIQSISAFMGVEPVLQYSDGLKQFTLYKADVDTLYTASMLYFVYNIGDITIYTVTSENGAVDAHSGIVKIDELASDYEIMEFFEAVTLAVDDQLRNFAIGSSTEEAKYFAENYSSDAFGTFTADPLTDAKSVAKGNAGSITWEVRADAYDQYCAYKDVLDAMVTKGTLTKMVYSGHDYFAAYSSVSDGKTSLYIIAYDYGKFVHSCTVSNGKLDTSTALVSSSAADKDLYNISNMVARSIGYTIYNGEAYTLLDAVKAYVEAVSPSFSGTWSYLESTTDDYSELRFTYAARTGTEKFNLITITKTDNLEAEYNAIAEQLKALDGEHAVMTFDYSEFKADLDATYYAVSYNGSSSAGLRFVMAVNGYLIDASGLEDRGDSNTKYLYCGASTADEQNAMMNTIMQNLYKYVNKVGSLPTEDLDLLSMAARFATDYNDGKTTYRIKTNYTDTMVQLHGTYLNNSGKERYFDIILTNEGAIDNAYADLSQKVKALDGTTFLSSTTYSLYEKDINGITYTAVSYSGDSMGSLRFCMMVGNVLVDASSLSVENGYPYMYIVSNKDTYDSAVAEIINLMYNSITSTKEVDVDAVMESDDPEPEPTPVEPDAIPMQIAEEFASLYDRDTESFAAVEDAVNNAIVRETYTNSSGNEKTLDFTIYAGTEDDYNTLADGIRALDGTKAMGSFNYALVDTSSIEGVSVVAVGSQLSSSFFLKFAMYSNGYIFETGGSYIYLVGADQAAASVAVMELMKQAMIAGNVEADEVPMDIATAFSEAYARDSESFAAVEDAPNNAILRETYTNSNGTEKTIDFTVYVGTESDYQALADGIRALDGTKAMGSFNYALVDTSSITGVKVAAVGSQLSNSYFVKFAMYCDGYIFETGAKYIYLTGADEAASALEVIALMKSAMVASMPVDPDTVPMEIAADFAGLYARDYESFVAVEDAVNNAILRETYTNSSGTEKTLDFKLYPVTFEEYQTLAAAIAELDGQKAMGSFNYALLDVPFCDGVYVTAVGSQLSNSYFLKFVMYYEGYVFETGEKYIYLTGADEAASALEVIDLMHKCMVEIVIIDFSKAVAIEFADEYSRDTESFEAFDGEKDDSAILRETYTNSSGTEKTIDFTVYSGTEEEFQTLADAITALDGTKAMGSFNYGLIDTSSITGVKVAAIGSQLSNSYFLKFAMYYDCYIFETGEKYIYLTGTDEAASALEVIALMKACLAMAADDSSAGAQKIAEMFVVSNAIGTESYEVVDGASAETATIRESYKNSSGTLKTLDFTVREGTYEEYETLAAAIAALDGTKAMGSFNYATIDTSAMPGVYVTAVGSQLSNSYFLKFVMYYDGMLFDTGEKYIYLSGTDVEAYACTVMGMMAYSMVDGATAIAYNFMMEFEHDGDTFNAVAGSTAESATIRETYTNSSGTEKTLDFSIVLGTEEEYQALADAITALDGTKAMGSFNYAIIDTSLVTGVKVAAVGSQLSNSYFLKFVMYYDGYIFQTGEKYVYLTGADEAASAYSLICSMKTAMMSLVPYSGMEGAEYFAAGFVMQYERETESFEVVDGATSETATLRESYKNSSGTLKTLDFTVKAGTYEEYETLAAAIAALDGTKAMGSFNYATIDASAVPGVYVAAVGSQLSNSYFLKFAMYYDGYIFETGEKYIYLTGADEAASAIDVMVNMATIMLDGAAVPALVFTQSVEVDGLTFTVPAGATGETATLKETYTNSSGTEKTLNFTVREGTEEEYQALADAITALDGTKAMGSFNYAIIDTSLVTGVKVAAVGSQLSNSYFLKFAMYYDGMLFDTGEKYIYISGTDVADTALGMIACMKTAMVFAGMW